ncbi:MAG: DUF4159 domain-containing protein [candidate division WOR-3 bacterium]|nr:DUF4159 domain-containing protein [candidate division WOR-3 bacterium]MDW8151047.1 DUF4159 domain-containing protein [candidate division WOR-3 bacterium]
MIQFLLSFQIARLQYEGGGDWYNDPEVIPNLVRFIKKYANISLSEKQAVVKPSSKDIFKYPILFMTGHGNVYFSDMDARNLREYLERGGFLYVDDDYGMDYYFRREIKKVFPDKELEEIPTSHPIFNIYWKFDKLPKIHQHDDKSPKAYGIFIGERLVLLYTYETNISDGWTDRHGDPLEVQETALKFGMNIVLYALTLQ